MMESGSSPRNDRAQACSASWARTFPVRNRRPSAFKEWPTRSERPVRRKKVLLVDVPRSSCPSPSGHVAQRIARRLVQTLFACNALATHDIEQALYGTSLGAVLGSPKRMRLEHRLYEHRSPGHRLDPALGGRNKAVELGVLKSGSCSSASRRASRLSSPARFVTTVLTEVIANTLQAQAKMREAIQGVGFAS